MLAFLEIMRSPNKRFTAAIDCRAVCDVVHPVETRCAECQDLEENGALEPKMFLAC
jgi:hypothetical protein